MGRYVHIWMEKTQLSFVRVLKRAKQRERLMQKGRRGEKRVECQNVQWKRSWRRCVQCGWKSERWDVAGGWIWAVHMGQGAAHACRKQEKQTRECCGRKKTITTTATTEKHIKIKLRYEKACRKQQKRAKNKKKNNSSTPTKMAG